MESVTSGKIIQENGMFSTKPRAGDVQHQQKTIGKVRKFCKRLGRVSNIYRIADHHVSFEIWANRGNVLNGKKAKTILESQLDILRLMLHRQ